MRHRILVAVPLFLLLLSNPLLAQTPSSGCTVAAYDNQTVDGKTLWVDVPNTPTGQNCNLDQLAWNNFLYLVTKDSQGHPRFMSFAPWYNVFPPKGAAPTWPGAYTPLDTTQIDKNRTEAGDKFRLLDITGAAVGYDMRVNKVYFDYISANGLYTPAKLQSAITKFDKDPYNGGVWFPAGDSKSKQVGAIEIKTAWRDFGPGKQACPTDIMHCEQDSAGNSWGLVGFHLVQKTPTHGEFVWMSFEHVANSPDCQPGGSNPIQHYPVAPTGAGTVNVNKNVQHWSGRTGWSFFDYSSYTAQGGDGKTCPFTKLVAGTKNTCDTTKALCLTDPNPSGDRKTFVPVNVCRSDTVAAGTSGCSQSTPNGQLVGCLNTSVWANFPSQVDAKWRYYMLIGIEWLDSGATGLGAPPKGCFDVDDGPGQPGSTQFGYNCPSPKKGLGEITRYTPAGTPHMANTTLETWMQKDLCLKTAGMGTWIGQDCFSCHQPPTLNYQADFSHLFGRIRKPGSSTTVQPSTAKTTAAPAHGGSQQP